MLGISISSGCAAPVKDYAPDLPLPDRPIFTVISIDEWQAIDPATREILAENQWLILDHVNKLELIIKDYQNWRNNRN